MTTLQNASVTTKRTYGKTNLNKTGTTNRTLTLNRLNWNTLNRPNNKKSPEQTNKNIYFNNKPVRTPIQKATAFNKQFVNTVKHATKRTNRKVDKQTKKLCCEPILISNHVNNT